MRARYDSWSVPGRSIEANRNKIDTHYSVLLMPLQHEKALLVYMLCIVRGLKANHTTPVQDKLSLIQKSDMWLGGIHDGGYFQQT
jgi:hypothetical protein